MTTLAEAKEDTKLLEHLPRLEERPKFCWHSGYYDGPLSGVCLYNDKHHWFKMIYEFDYEGDEEWEPGEKEILLGRIFVVAELSDEQFAIIKDRHDVWRNYIGRHCDYDEDGKRPYMSDDDGKALIKYSWDKYNEAIATKPEFPELNNNKVVAWWGSKQFNFDACLLKQLEVK